MNQDLEEYDEMKPKEGKPARITIFTEKDLKEVKVEKKQKDKAS